MNKELKSAQASKELQRLIDYIKEHQLNLRYDLAVNCDGILYLVNTELRPEEDWSISCDFGFDCKDDYGFLYLFKQVPDDDPIAIMEQQGIMVGRLENYADWIAELEEDGDESWKQWRQQRQQREIDLALQEVELVDTGHNGRIERIEKVHIGDNVQIVRVPDDQFPIDVQNEDGSLGRLPTATYELSSKMDAGKVKEIKATVSSVLPLSERKKTQPRARKPILVIRIKIEWNEK